MTHRHIRHHVLWASGDLERSTSKFDLRSGHERPYQVGYPARQSMRLDKGNRIPLSPPFQNIYLFSISISISIIYQLSINYLSLSIIELNYLSQFQLSISYLFLSLFKISIIIFGQKTYVIMTHYKRHKAVIPNVTPAPLSFQSQLP